MLTPVCSPVLSPAWHCSYGRVGRGHSLEALLFSRDGGHAGARAATSQCHTWRPNSSCLAEGGGTAPFTTSSSSHYGGEGQIRASLRLREKCPRDGWSLTILPCNSLRSLSDEYIHSGQTSAMCCSTMARGADLSPHVVEAQSHLYPSLVP